MQHKKMHAQVVKIVKDDHRICSGRVIWMEVKNDEGELSEVTLVKEDNRIPKFCTGDAYDVFTTFEEVWTNVEVGDFVMVHENEETGAVFIVK